MAGKGQGCRCRCICHIHHGGKCTGAAAPDTSYCFTCFSLNSCRVDADEYGNPRGSKK